MNNKRIPWNKGKTAKDDPRILAGKDNPAYGKVYNTKENNPEWAAKVSSTSKERGINKGNSNGMKNPEARARASETRKRKFKEDLEFAKQHAEMTKKSWADGKHNNTQVGRCKWFDYIKKDGTVIKCQGSWELKFAKWADENGLKFEAHKGRIPYKMNGEDKNYYPDFYVYDWKCYIDTKSKYFQDLNKEKIKCILASNPDLNLKILGKEDLNKLGIKV